MIDRPYSNWEGLPQHWDPNSGLSFLNRLLFEDAKEDSSAKQIAEVGVALTCLLVLKNQRYGNSALEPISVFAKDLTTRQRMAVRMDDKANRIRNGLGITANDGEHPGIDLAGYLLLDVIAAWDADRRADHS